MAFHTQVGDVVSGVVQSVMEYGVFVHLGKTSSLLHISQISRDRVVDASEVFSTGDKIKVGRSNGLCNKYSACVAAFAHRGDKTLPSLNTMLNLLDPGCRARLSRSAGHTPENPWCWAIEQWPSTVNNGL